MKKVGLFGALALVGLLAACSAAPKAELTTAGRGELQVFTDVEALVKPLGAFANVEFVKTGALVGVATERGAGLVGYTPDTLDESGDVNIPRIPNPLCLLLACDDDGNLIPDSYDGYLTLGQDFVGVYVTPALVEQAARYRLDIKDLRQADAGTLTKVIAASGLRVGLVGQYLPGSWWERLCSRQPVPKICHVIDSFDADDLVVDIHDAREIFGDLGIIITDYGGLVQSGVAGKLVQVHGEDLEPTFSALEVGFHAGVDKGAATEFLEYAYSHEGQVSLAQAGFLPVTEGAFAETVSDEVRPHVEDALEYGVNAHAGP